ncbi:40S ribosomal protein mrp2, mitochondrial [Nowakowskiella sp. JEL0078]|nr:40S ribosomal protein mrp2, mitochondrial [Nowakowskiella sp. JEL0078]
MPLANVIRDKIARQLSAENEISREALKLIIRNPSLKLEVRMQAQLTLNNYPRYTRPASIKSRCTESGKARGVLSDFKLSRIVNYRESESLLGDRLGKASTIKGAKSGSR